MVAWARILVQIVGQSSSYGGFIVLYLFMIMSIITDSTKDSTVSKSGAGLPGEPGRRFTASDGRGVESDCCDNGGWGHTRNVALGNAAIPAHRRSSGDYRAGTVSRCDGSHGFAEFGY